MPVQVDANLGGHPVRQVVVGVIVVVALVQYCLVAPLAGDQANANKDFSHLWLGGRMVVSGHADMLYDPQMQERVHREADPLGRSPGIWIERNTIVGGFFYPPPTALAYSVLAWLPLRTAAVVLAYLNILLGVGMVWFLARRIHGRLSVGLVGLALLLYPAYFVTVALGQNSVVTLAVVLLAWWLCDRDRDFIAGLVLGLLICKPNWLLAVGWIPLIHGRWRVLAGVGCSVFGLVAGSISLIGIEPYLGYMDLLRNLANLHELPGYNLHLTYNGLSVFRKWLGAGQAVELLGWCSSALMILVTWRVTRGRWKPRTGEFQLLMGCCLAASLWINPHLFYYDLTPTVACVVLMGAAWPRLGRGGRQLTAALIILTYLAIPVDDFWPWKNLVPLPSFTTLGVWLWFCWQLAGQRRTIAQPALSAPAM